MANRRQKKKKSAAAAKQAATQYKGKNAPLKAAPVKKPVEKPVEAFVKAPEQPAEKPAVQEKKPEIKKPEQPVKKEVKPAKVKAQPKSKPQKPKPEKKKISASKPKLSKRLKSAIERFGVGKFAAIVLGISAVIAAVCIGIWVSSSRFGIPSEAIPKYSGRNISSDITLTVNHDLATQYDFSDKMNRKGDTKAFRYYAAEDIVFPEKNSLGTLNLVNVYDNECVIVATVIDENGYVCFSSLGLPPGECLTDISIDSRPYGTYKMKLVVSGFDPETYKLIGVQSSALTVQVGIEEEETHVEETEK